MTTSISDPRLASMSPDELKSAMRTLGYRTQGDLANAIGVSRSTVSLWLEGKVGVPRPVAMLLRMLIAAQRRDIAGLHAVVIGRSNIVGRPMAQLLLRADCTVTVAHSKTRDLPALCRTADILVAAIGRPEMIRGDWIKPGAIVIDVGINRRIDADGTKHLIGDVHFAEAERIAGAITPVPGGVGPMTIACLLRNTLALARARRGLDRR